MESLQEVIKKIESHPFDMDRAMPYLHFVNEGSWSDIIGSHANYYRFMASMMDLLKPKQVIELGSAAGASALMMTSHLPNDSMLYACTIPEPEGEFRFIQEDYPNLTLIRGNDLDLTVWKDIDLKKTDIWFFDTDHNYHQIHSELNLYAPFFKKGALCFLDDIDLNEGMKQAWSEIKYDKLSIPHWHSYHKTGFGVFRV